MAARLAALVLLAPPAALAAAAPKLGGAACDPIAADEAQQGGSSDASLVQLLAQRHGSDGTARSQGPQRAAAAAQTMEASSASGTEKSPNSTLLSFVQAELEYELHIGQDPLHAKTRSKAVLAIVSLLGLGFCGVDRCCMGQIFIGFMKGMSCGGLFVWFTIDYIVILVNCLLWSSRMDTAAWYTTFHTGTVMPAFLMYVAAILLMSFCALYKPKSNMVTLSSTLRRKGLISMRPTAFEMEEMFARFDSDLDGCLDSDELKKAMAQLGRPLPETEIDVISQRVGQDGKLKIEELVAVLCE